MRGTYSLTLDEGFVTYGGDEVTDLDDGGNTEDHC
jgi:hypothetical protein